MFAVTILSSSVVSFSLRSTVKRRRRTEILFVTKDNYNVDRNRHRQEGRTNCRPDEKYRSKTRLKSEKSTHVQNTRKWMVVTNILETQLTERGVCIQWTNNSRIKDLTLTDISVRPRWWTNRDYRTCLIKVEPENQRSRHFVLFYFRERSVPTTLLIVLFCTFQESWRESIISYSEPRKRIIKINFLLD